MRRWDRAGVPIFCGNCSALVKIGDPILVLTIDAGVYHVERLKFRCASCTGEAVPELPVYVERARAVPRMLPLKAMASTVDFKGRQAGADDAA